MVKVTGTLMWYYFICKREVWLMAHEITPFKKNDLLEIGRLIHEDSYKREKKEVNIFSMRIDVVKKSKGKLLICEIKKSSSYLLPARMQLLFYLFRLKERGVTAEGELLIPEEKKKEIVKLDGNGERKIQKTIKDITKIINEPNAPKVVKSRFCKKCAYYEFCWS